MNTKAQIPHDLNAATDYTGTISSGTHTRIKDGIHLKFWRFRFDVDNISYKYPFSIT